MTVDPLVYVEGAFPPLRRLSAFPDETIESTDPLVWFEGEVGPLSSFTGETVETTDPLVVKDGRLRRLSRFPGETLDAPEEPPPPENLILNGDASDGTSHWTVTALFAGDGTITVSGGKLRVTAGAPGYVLVTQGFATDIGETYRITGDMTNVSAGQRYLRKCDVDGSNIVNISSSGGTTDGAGLTGTFVATATTSYVVLQSNGGVCDFDNIVVAAV